MKRNLFKLLIIMVLSVPFSYASAQDAYFADDYETKREDVTGFSFGNFLNGEGFGFGNFSQNVYGMGFEDFMDYHEGMDFSGFDFENGNNVPLDGGLLLLCGFAMLRLKSKDKRRKEVN